MKCLEKDRTRRYETASGLARDVERYLHDEPVEACPPSAGYRVRKFVRKHRMPVTVAAAFGLLLVAGIVVSAWHALRAVRAEGEAVRQRDRAALEATNARAAGATCGPRGGDRRGKRKAHPAGERGERPPVLCVRDETGEPRRGSGPDGPGPTTSL